MKAWRELLGVTVFAVGVGAVCAQNAPVLGNIEAPYAALQGSVMLASTTWGPGAVAYGPIGTPLVLTGHDLGFSGTVQFIPYKNGVVDTDPNVSPVPATVTMWTSNMLILTVPSSAMTGLVKVTTDGLTSNGLPFLVTSNTPYAGICPANPASTQLQITTASLHDGNAGQAYSATLGATGGKTAYTWSITSGTLPAGLSLNATSGLISGTPTTASGLVDLTFEVTDSSSPNQRDQAVLSLGIVSPSIASTTPVTVYDFCVPGPWNSNTNPSCGTTPSGYDAVGNLKSYSDTAYDGTAVVDSVMGTWSFTYDTLNRMITGTGTPLAGSSSGQNYCWAYDSFGNRTVQVIQTAACPTLPAVPAGAITFTSKNQVPNTVTGTSAVSYDAAGNALSAVTSIGQTYYSYDAEGRICAMQSTPISGMNVAYGYLYDANDTRVAKGSITPVSNPATQSLSCDPTQNGFQFTENYVLGPSGEELTQFSVANGVTTWQRTNVYATGKLLATYDLVNNPLYVDGGSQPTQVAALHFHPTDPLGTRRMQLAGNLPGNSAGLAPLGQPETDIQSLPFGDQLSSFPDQYATNTSDDSTPLHFTGKERDTESGNDYFSARYYSSAMGRFMSPDPILQNDLRLLNPQRWNKYAYVINNPLILTDPTGLDAALVNFSGMAGDFGHSGVMSIHSDGSATFSYKDGEGQIHMDDSLPKVQFGANGTPTSASYAELAKAVADFDTAPGKAPIDPASVGIVYFKTTDSETANLDQYIAQRWGNQEKYRLIGKSCLDYAVGGLNAAGVTNRVPYAKHFVIPNNLWLWLEPQGDDSNSRREKVTHRICDANGQNCH